MFHGARAIITGGSSGLGKLLAERLLAQGAEVALFARDRGKLDAVRAELLARWPQARVQVVSCDVSDAERVVQAVDALVGAWGAPSVLINSAGVLAEGAFTGTPVAMFREIMDINFFGTVHMCKVVVLYMVRAGSGRIVNISSMAGLMGVYGYSAYCASKHALHGLSGALRMELLPHGVRVHLVCPPEFESPMVDALNRSRSEENRAVVTTIPPMRADEVADATLRGLRRERYEIVVGAAARWVRLADRWFPALGRRVADFKLARLRRASASR
jgi:3-dehydrosphinganine reductase